MKRIIKISLLLVFAVAQMGCDISLLLPPFWGGKLGLDYDIDESKQYEGVCFSFRGDTHYKIALFNEHFDSIIYYKGLGLGPMIIVDPIDVFENNPYEDYDTAWHYAMATYLGGITHCKIYKVDKDSQLNSWEWETLQGNVNLWEGTEDDVPVCTFEMGDGKPNSFFNLGNWEKHISEGYEYYGQSWVKERWHKYTYTIREPLEE